MKITSKAQFYDMWRTGLLGNRTRLWTHAQGQEAFDSGCPEYGFRQVSGAGGGKWACVIRPLFWHTLFHWQKHFSPFMIDDRVPDSRQTIIGELCRTEQGMQGFIGWSQIPMRPAIAQGLLKHRSYLETLVLINTYMDPSSRDDIDALFELFPDATIEFACFDCAVGVLRRNTMIWEVRDY